MFFDFICGDTWKSGKWQNQTPILNCAHTSWKTPIFPSNYEKFLVLINWTRAANVPWQIFPLEIFLWPWYFMCLALCEMPHCVKQLLSTGLAFAMGFFDAPFTASENHCAFLRFVDTCKSCTLGYFAQFLITAFTIFRSNCHESLISSAN